MWKFVVLHIQKGTVTLAALVFDYDDPFGIGQATKRELDSGNSILCFATNDTVEEFDRRKGQ